MTRYAIISPVRNEREYLALTFESVTAQTTRPRRWVIVDDGSSDGTCELARGWALRHSWISVIARERQDHGGRGAPVVRAFLEGLAGLGANTDVEFLVKLDGDVSFPPQHYEQLLSRFESSPQLGIAGGSLHEQDEAGNWIAKDMSPGSVAGPNRVYRMSCYQHIGGIAPAYGWDGIDEVEAQMRGWLTGTQSDLPYRHHRPEGARAGRAGRYLEQGYGAHYMGYDPLYLLLRAARSSARRHRLGPGALLIAGWIAGYLRGNPQHPHTAARRFLRHRQRMRLLSMVGLAPASQPRAAADVSHRSGGTGGF